jgi:hypothetical protein
MLADAPRVYQSLLGICGRRICGGSAAVFRHRSQLDQAYFLPKLAASGPWHQPAALRIQWIDEDELLPMPELLPELLLVPQPWMFEEEPWLPEEELLLVPQPWMFEEESWLPEEEPELPEEEP